MRTLRIHPGILVYLLALVIVSSATVSRAQALVEGSVSGHAFAVGPDVVVSPNDDRQYRYLTLSNQLRVLLVSDATADKAAAALDVHVGSADDPADRQGLAHFLEHMLFLGTEKYPQPDEYQAFISAHGGTHNAYTSAENTNYFFDIDHTKLEPALDRFAQFFIAPLFSESYVERERHAVNSEYKSKIKNDYRRELDVYRELVSSRHPLSKFSVGSLETLSNQDDDSLREDLLTFYQDYYSARNMTLVVLGRESLAELQAMVVPLFSQVSDHELKSFISDEPLFREDFLPARLSVRPVKDERRLTLIFPVPSADRYYREKPLQYLGNILGHEGEGSLLSLLKELGWAEGLSAGAGMGGRNEGSFNISIQLTPDGYVNQAKVVATVFRMVQLLRQDGIEDWRFDEQKTLADIAFRFAEKGEAIQVVSGLAGRMHEYPAEDVVRGSYAFDDYEPRLIRSYLKLLSPNNLLWVVSAPEVETNQVSEYYHTPYALERLRFESASVAREALDKLHLPEENRFLPRRLQVKPLPAMDRVAQEPRLIKQTGTMEAWFKQDDRFQVPRATISIRTYAPLVGQSARNAAMAQLYAELINDELNEFAYPALLAGLHFNVNANSRGFDIRLGGYNDRQGALLNRILDVIERSRFKKQRFATMKQELIRKWRNQKALTPYEQLFEKAPVLLFAPLWDELAMADALESVEALELRRFADDLWRGSRTQTLLYGNLYRQEALKLATLIEHKLYRPAEEGAPSLPVAQVVQLPQGSRHYHLPVEHRDVAAMLYTQALGDTVEDQAQMMMLQQMLRSSFFHELRTEKQLGYIVFVSGMGLKDVSGNLFVVQSPNTPLDVVTAEIQAFVSAQAGNVEGFENYRQALLTQLREEPKNLQEQSGRYWSEVVAGHSEFDRRQRLIDAVVGLTPETVGPYSRAVLGEARALWLTAGAESVAIPGAEAVTDVQGFKQRSERYIYP